MPIRRRFLSPVWLALSLPLYIGLRLLPGLTQAPWGIGVGATVLTAACVLIPRSVRRRDRSAWLGLIAMGFLSTLFVMTLLRDGVLLCARIVFGAGAYAALVQPSAVDALVLTAVFTWVGFLLARRPRLVHVDIPLSGSRRLCTASPSLRSATCTSAQPSAGASSSAWSRA